MGEMEINKAEKKGFFKELLHRRVLQITGFYLGGGWGVLQFFDWIVDRYLLSPFLVDLALTIIISLLPTIVTIAYFHGIPGKNKWRKREKILVPVNLALSIILVFLIFGSKDLSSIASRVSVVDEKGKKIEQLVPKKGVVKKLTIFYFDNDSGKKDSDWMQYGIVDILTLDLSQDPFLNITSPSSSDPFKGFYIFQKIKDAGFPDATRVPLMLQKNIAADLNAKHFMSGTISKTGEITELKVSVYQTRDNRLVADKIFRNKDIFVLIDELTVFIKKSLKLPSYKNSEIVDLPIKDMFTFSEKAARMLTEAGISIIKDNNYSMAQKLLEEAVMEDNSFTIAYAQLAEIYALNNRTDKWKSTFKELMKHLYKLPEKMKMQLKAGYYQAVKGEPEKTISILKMIIKLFPNDISNYSVLASRLYITGDYEESIVYYRKILEIEPEQYEIYDRLGRAYEGKGDLESALINYKKYSEQFPNKVAGFLKIGGIEEKLGNFEKAAELYDKALLLDPEKISTVLLIARLDIKAGKFGDALEIYEEALQTAKNEREKASVYSALARYYKLRGQLGKSMSMMNEYYKMSEHFIPPLQLIITKVLTGDIFLKNGKEKEVLARLDKAKNQLSPPFDKIVSIGYMVYHIHQGDLNIAEKYLTDIHELVDKMGNKQLLLIADGLKAKIAEGRGEYEKSLSLYKDVLEKDANDILTINAISTCLLKIKDNEKGLENIKNGLRISPFHPRINFIAAQLFLAVKDKDKAIMHLKKAVKGWEESDAGYKPAIEARKMLKNLTLGG